ncbi:MULTISPECIES: DUF3888 domain-containing protein [Bacillus]|uniref:DUF3888 domain-containing protein n=1 Tax=Bacillus TaxID=1386 RepID=UPI0012FF1CBE|nr:MULTISPECIES: DUF3888 domain-containing protein [Bacillus]
MKRYILICLLVFATPIHTFAETPYIPTEQSREELYQDIFLSLLTPQVHETIGEFYKKEAGLSFVAVYPYQTVVEKVERIGGYRSFVFEVTLLVNPVVGAHIPVGEDRLHYEIGGSGDVKLLEHQHIRSIDLPDWYKK